MTKEEILKIAQEYDLIANNAQHGISLMGIVNFGLLIANYEREQCAIICETLELPEWPNKVRLPLAQAIRARGLE